MSILVLWICAIVLFTLVISSFLFPNPVVWISAMVFAVLFFGILLPKYQGQQEAIKSGVKVQADFKEIRHWQRKQGDGKYIDRYEIKASWTDPQTGKAHIFVSEPLNDNPEGKIPAKITVWIVPNRPDKAYLMDISFLK